MKFKQIIKNVAVILGLSDVVSLVNDTLKHNSQNAKAELRGNINFAVLLRCVNFVVANIATNYFPLVARQSFVVTNGRIRLSEFEKPLVSIRQIARNGREVEHKLHSGYINVPNGNLHVEYSYMPQIKTGEEQNPFEITPSAIEYGILSEYAFISGMMNEATVWNGKFTELLFNAKRGRGKTMPAGMR